MKVIIAGSRHYPPELATQLVQQAIKNSGYTITHLINGTAKGIDQAAARWAKQNNIPTINYPPNWKEHGKAAGPIRNQQMVNNADALILIWDGQSKGSKNILQQAQNKRLKIHQETHPQETREE